MGSAAVWSISDLRGTVLSLLCPSSAEKQYDTTEATGIAQVELKTGRTIAKNNTTRKRPIGTTDYIMYMGHTILNFKDRIPRYVSETQ